MVKINLKNDKIYLVDGDVTTLCDTIVTDKKTGKSVVKLPQNSANRKWLVVDKITDGMELEYKETKTFGPRLPGQSKKAWFEYLEGDDYTNCMELLKQLDELKAIAEENKKRAMERPQLTEKEKLQLKIKKLMAQIEMLEAAE